MGQEEQSQIVKRVQGERRTQDIAKLGAEFERFLFCRTDQLPKKGSAHNA